MKYLALDIGTKRTGAAFVDDSIGIPVPLATIEHSSFEQLATSVSSIITQRKIDNIIVGNPYLPDGSEGSQSRLIQSVVTLLCDITSLPIELVDERYSNIQENGGDLHSNAAIWLLRTKINC